MTPYHILLVEDETVIRDFVKNRLTTEGYRVSEAENIKTAEVFLHESQPDLIVLDIMLPDGSGLELCRNLRGIAQERPKRSTPGMRPSVQYRFTHRSDTPHLYEVSRTDNQPFMPTPHFQE